MSEHVVPELSRSDEYKQLIAQKREIDKKLKELQHKRISFGSVKVDRQRWYSYGRKSYNVKIKKFIGMNCPAAEQDRYYTIIEDFNLKKILEVLTSVIDDLVILKEYLNQEVEEDENTNQNPV